MTLLQLCMQIECSQFVLNDYIFQIPRTKKIASFQRFPIDSISTVFNKVHIDEKKNALIQQSWEK